MKRIHFFAIFLLTLSICGVMGSPMKRIKSMFKGGKGKKSSDVPEG
jgi:hypothetical protein